jgi:hypothetical protein
MTIVHKTTIRAFTVTTSEVLIPQKQHTGYLWVPGECNNWKLARGASQYTIGQNSSSAFPLYFAPVQTSETKNRLLKPAITPNGYRNELHSSFH